MINVCIVKDMKNNANPLRKIHVGIIFGGRSAEHEVSILSAKSVVAALDTSKFEPSFIGIDKSGGWHWVKTIDELEYVTESRSDPSFSPAKTLAAIETAMQQQIDVIFPILHGPYGEDGTVQGFLELMNIPYIGCGVVSSAASMDKDIAKRLLRDAGIPIADFMTFSKSERESLNDSAIIRRLGLPLFVKPANMGSSIGVSKVSAKEELLPAIDAAFRHDTKILLEKAIVGDEVECAVLGNDQPKVSVPGRIIPSADFYTYEAKYHDEDGTILEIPAKVSQNLARKVQELSLEAFKALNCQGMARVDMFVTEAGSVLVNEVNTIPGFTKFSMYPQLWEASGIPYTALITQLIELAM